MNGAKHFFRVFILGCGLCLEASVAQGAPFTNGSFESATTNPGGGLILNLGAGNTSITGWTVTSDNIDYIGGFWRASDGNRSLDLNGCSTGGISQTFDTTPGNRYEVKFDIAGEPFGPIIKHLRVSAAGTLTDFTFNSTGTTRSNMGWQERTFNFTASDSTTTLAFISLDGSCSGPALDNVRVSAAGCAVPSGGAPRRVNPPNIVSGLSCGPGPARGDPLRSWNDGDDNEFQLFCQDIPDAAPEFHLNYVTPSGSRQVGRCPWEGGRNFSEILHTGDNNSDGAIDCFLSSFWLSREPGLPELVVPNQGVSPTAMDWKAYLFNAQTGTLVLKHYISFDGPGGIFPDTLVDTKVNVPPDNFDPPLGSPPMVADDSVPCDIDRDGDCDNEDLLLVENLMGQCDSGNNYNTLADADHDGCVTTTDQGILLSSDFDNDGTLDFDDACPNSDLSPTLVIGGCDSGVNNQSDTNACSIADQIKRCGADASNHGQFVSCVAHLTNELKKSGIISGKEKGAIQSCAAQAHIP
jgi:choice-of-anchor C domain-containing protein